MRCGSVLYAGAAIALAILRGGIALGDSPAAPTRLAVIAQGQSVPCRGLADLLQVELSRRDGIELVEREEIDRVLAEQTLTASGLVAESARIHLGALLKADGLLFVDQTVSTNNVFHLRLVETKQGYVAGFMIHAAKTPMAQTLAAIDRSLANLSLPAEQRVGVSVLAFDNALPANLGAEPIVETFMADVEERLMIELAAIPGALVLERRKLGDVVQEEALSGEARALMAGTLVVDGGLTRAPEIGAQKTDNPQVVLTLRLRNLATGAGKIIKAEGGLPSLRSMEQKVLADLFEVAMALRAEAGSGMLQAEVKILDDLVNRYSLPWAGEAGVALDKSDRKRVESYVKTLAGLFDSVSDDRAKAVALAQVETLCREHGISLSSALRCGSDRSVLVYLKRPETFKNPELSRLLRPLRTALVVELERTALHGRSPGAFDMSVEWLAGVVPLPSERRIRLLTWYDKLHADPATSDSMRYFLSTYLLYVTRWSSVDLAKFRKSDDPVCRFHANRVLLTGAKTRREQIEYSDAMLEDLGAFLARTKGVNMEWHFLHTGARVARSGQKYTPNRWPSESLRDLNRYRPEFKETVQRKFFERMKGLLDEKDFGAIDFLECDLMLTTIPEREVFDWMCQIIDQGKTVRHTEELIDNLERWRTKILARHPEFQQKSRLKERVLFSVQTDGERLRQLTRPPANANRSSSVSIQRILVDGDTLWVGMQGGPLAVRSDKLSWYNPMGEGVKSQWYRLLGVLEIDLARGAVKSERARWFPLGGGDILAKSFYPLGNMFRIGDFLAMHNPGVGIVAIPVRDRDMAGCRLLGFDEGLPLDASAFGNGYSGSLVEMPRGVCLALRQWIVHWDFDTWQSRIILDVEDPASDLGYPDRGKYIMALQSDPQTEDLWLNVGVISRIDKTSSGVGTAATPTCFHAKGFSGGWKEIPKEEWPPRSEQGLKIDSARRLLKDSMVLDVRDVALWRDEIIVLHGPDDDHLKLSVFSPREDGGESEH